VVRGAAEIIDGGLHAHKFLIQHVHPSAQRVNLHPYLSNILGRASTPNEQTAAG
jgi:hypothetical protein